MRARVSSSQIATMMRATTTTTTAALEGRGFLFFSKKGGEREERFTGQRGGGEDVFFTRGGRRGRRRRGSELRPFAARGDGGQKGVLSSGEYSFSSAAIAREIGEEDAEEEPDTVNKLGQMLCKHSKKFAHRSDHCPKVKGKGKGELCKEKVKDKESYARKR